MKALRKVLETKTKIRFQDCDPFNHLNNAAYINYFNNAREDQLIENYGIDIYSMARKEGKSWVTGSNQIAYLRPAFLMEEVIIESQLVQYTTTQILVELRMYNSSKEELKAIMWSNFVHFNLLQQKREEHSEELMALFKKVENPITKKQFEARVASFKRQRD